MGGKTYKKAIVHLLSKCLPCAEHIGSGGVLGLKTDVSFAFMGLELTIYF